MFKRAKRSKPGATHKRLLNLRNHPFVIPVTTLMVLFFMVIIGFIGFSGTTVGATDVHVVSLNIDGKEQIIPTRAASVSDLLKRLDIKVGEKDIVNPGLDTPIEEDNFTVNLYTARPVLVEDGAKRTIIYTAEPTLDAVAKAAGFEVFPEDKLTAAPAVTNDPVKLSSQEGFVAEQLVINRATPINLNLYGTSVTIRSQAKTVGDLLTEKDIKLNEGDTLRPDAATPLTDNMEVFVVRVGKQIAQQEETIEPPVEYVEDYNLTAGSTKVQDPGTPGKKLVTYEIEQQNGVETSRRIIQEVIVSQPLRKLVARGKKAPVVVGDKANIMSAAGISVNQHYAADFIISHESGWRVNAINSRGCGGLGQACPASKLSAACPNWQSDAVCQMRFFNSYAVNRYGSWTRAMEIWQNQRWW